MARKPRKLPLNPSRPLTEIAALSQFVETWRLSSKLLPLAEAERDTIFSVVAKCEHRLKEMDAERRKAFAEAEAWAKEYEAGRNEQIQAGHKVSGYSNWIRIAHGSYGQPKK